MNEVQRAMKNTGKKSTVEPGYYRMNLEPPIPIVPRSHFKPLDSVNAISFQDAWHLVGPTIQVNMANIPVSEYWKLYSIAFIEGMRMAVFTLKEEREANATGDTSKSEQQSPKEGLYDPDVQPWA